MRFMKKNLKVLLLAVFVAAASCSFTTKSIDDPDKDKVLIELITYVLEKLILQTKSLMTNFQQQFTPSLSMILTHLKDIFWLQILKSLKI